MAGCPRRCPGGYDQERSACERALCTASAAFSRWLTGQIASGDAALAYTVIGLQRRTLGAMLGHALDRQAWDDASGIFRALNEYWDTRGLGAQLGLLAEARDQAPEALEWNIRCVTLFGEFPSRFTGTAPAALARLTRQLGTSAL